MSETEFRKHSYNSQICAVIKRPDMQIGAYIYILHERIDYNYPLDDSSYIILERELDMSKFRNDPSFNKRIWNLIRSELRKHDE
jgi:hypothetical protein